MTGLLELADRCEVATRGNDSLDAEVAIAFRIPPSLAYWAVKFPDWRIGSSFGRARVEVWDDGAMVGHWIEFAAYTASLDAAITLLPENADAAGERYRLEAYNSNGVLAEHVRASAWVAGAQRVYAATPALALTAAALRARHAQEQRGEGNGPRLTTAAETE